AEMADLLRVLRDVARVPCDDLTQFVNELFCLLRLLRQLANLSIGLFSFRLESRGKGSSVF
ncbi:MAG TPA: hypothetical protein VGB05_05765, partial [Pyrinomonadaceae bacterium]